MDNITHSLTAVLLSRTGPNRVIPRATWTLFLASNAPDIDFIAFAGGPLSYLRYHRGLTHAVAGAPLVAALATLVMWLPALWRKEKYSWGRTYLVALIGVALHALMDFTNVYGIRPWYPFADTWYSWDISFLVDVWLWVAMLAALAAPALGRMISGEIGAPAGSGRGWAVAALLFVALWWGARDVSHRRALAMLDSHLYGGGIAAGDDSDSSKERPGEPPLRVAAFPNPTNPLEWRGFVETEAFYQILTVNVLRPLDPTRGQVVYKPEPSPALEAA
ncbi:MAG: metal-dependent hydrolase, partial [Acidobacteria bacterium]|nr:metal-dependent hydrolase [Acidobacteriota bacterium]